MPFLLPAAASAVAAAAPAAAASAGIGATLTSIAGNVLMNVAISAAMSVFQPQVGVAGRTFEWTLDPDGPIPFAAGRIGVPGSAVYRKTFGPDLMYYGIPSVLSGAGPIDGYEAFLADDESVTFDGSGKAVSSQYAGELWYKTKLGTQPDTAITSPTGLKNGATLPGWTSAHKLSGKACYMIVMGENSKGTAFPTGEIKPLITLRGLKVYDPRKDDTYPGGSGAHRLANPATWAYSTNPILWALKWTLGLWEGPNGKGAPQVDYQVGGIGAKLSGIDVPAFVAAANVADANGWTCAAYPTTDDDKHQVLTGFLQAGGAIYAQRAGKISCIQRAAPRTSIVTISAYDTAGPLEIDTAASRIDRINTLRPRFWSEPHRWQMTALDQEVTAQAYRDEDGAVRTRGIDYPYVTNAVQAGQLAALQIANTREGIAGVIPLKPHLQRIRPGDAFTITEAGVVLNGLKCLCLNTDYDPATGVVRVSFVSETDGKYPFALGQNPTPPTPQILTPVDPRFVSPPLPGDWVITPRPPGAGGALMPGFDLSGSVGNTTATAIEVQWWEVPANVDPNDAPPEDANWQSAGTWPPTASTIPIDVQADRYYWLGLIYIRNQNYSERTPSGPWLAGELIAGDVSPDAPGLSPIKADIEAAFGDIFDVSGQLAAARSALEATDAALYGNVLVLNEGLAEARADTYALYDNVVALDTGLSGLQDIVSEQSVDLADKASQTDLALQVVRIDDAAAINASQALALVDLENSKVALSEYEVLRGEVLDARYGAPSLLGQIQYLQSVDLDLDARKVELDTFSELVARTDGVEAVNAAQAEVLIDIEAGKVEVSEYDILKAEVVAGRNGAPSLLGQIQYLQSVDLDLASRKVEVTEFEELAARTDGVEAVNANQALALIDLENAKVALSEYNTLKGEVTAARDGAPSLLGQIQNLKTVDLDLQNNKASVASVDALTARAATTEADIIDLENALATEAGARAEAISQVAARQAINQNLMPNGSGENGPVGWSGPGLQAVNVPALGGTLIKFALAGSYVENYASSPRAKVSGGQTVTLQWKGVVEGTFSGSLQIYIAFLKADGSYAGEGARKSVTDANPVLTSTAPSDAAFAILSLFINGNAGLGVNVLLSRCKIEAGSVATIYSNDATAAALSAAVTEQSLAIIDLENNQALASWRVKAEATGGKPAVLEIVSSSLGSFIALGAEQIFQGDNTVVDTVSQTVQGVFGSMRRVIANGPPFGPDNLIHWTGPSNIALSAMSKANAGFWQDQVGAYGPTPLPSFWAKVTPTQISRSRTGAGSISTALNDVIVTCYTGTSGATCTWSRVSGDATINYPSTGFTPVFNTTLAAGQTKTALFVGLVAKGGDVDLVYVNVEFSDNV